MNKYLLLSATAPVVGLLVLGIASCGGPSDAGSPIPGAGGYPGTGGFNPGGGGNAGYAASGATGNGGSLDGGTDAIEEPGPPDCGGVEFQRCDHVFTYAGTGNETSVELRGDFSSDGWDKGVLFQKAGTSWTATVPVPMNFSFQYKLVIDGTNWITDPSNPTKVPDGLGKENSVFAAESCTWWTCSQEAAPLACAETVRTCSHKFTYPLGSETSVTLIGDFASDGWTTGVPMSQAAPQWVAKVAVPWGSTVLYKYKINGGASFDYDHGNADMVDDGYGGYNSRIEGVKCGWWSCGGSAVTNDWPDRVLYFAFVDRFLDGDPTNNGTAVSGVSTAANYQGGDWKGVLNKIDDGYFTDLGVTALWLTVPMNNPDALGIGDDGKPYSGYHGYWPVDLDQTESRFGSMTELKNVVTAAHGKGIKVILDYAMNHVHSSSPVYAQHNDWFWPLDFSDGNGSHHCICGDGSCPWEGAYAKRCWFRDYLPDFNFTNADARKFSIDNALWWVGQTGIDGFRLDAVKHIEDQWVLDLRARVKAEIETVTNDHFYMVGETFTGDQNLIKYYVKPSMLDGQFDFPMRNNLAQSVLMRSQPMSSLDSFMGGNDSYYGASALMSTFIGNHDMPRAIHFAENAPMWSDVWANGKDKNWSNQPTQPAGDEAYQRLANAFTILMTTHGVPLIYYGDEVGLAGAGDPDNRRMMQWSGYSAGQTLLLDHMKKLGKLRVDHSALRRGTRTSVNSGADTFVYKMADSTETIYVVVNRGDSTQSVGGLPSGALTNLLTNAAVTGPTVSVPARSSLILK